MRILPTRSKLPASWEQGGAAVPAFTAQSRSGHYRAILPALALATVVLSWPATVEADDFGFKEYTFGISSCTVKKDPLNMYFVDYDWLQAEGMVRIVLGLTWDLIATDQWFKYTWRDGITHCKKQVYNRASMPISPREHTRQRDNRPVDVFVTASPIHKDELSWCGDVAVSFNNPRNWAAGRFTDAGLPWEWVWTGNNLAIAQCDGRLTASDGWLLRVNRP